MTRPAATIAEGQLTALDRAILRDMWRHGQVRRSTLSGLTGASGWSIKERVGALAARGLLARTTEPAILRDADGALVRTRVVVWQMAGRGHRHAGEWTVTGTDQAITATARSLPAVASMTRTLAGAHLDAWYRAYGYEAATQREIARAARLSGTPTPWAVTVCDDQRLPLLGVVGPEGRRWAAELVLETRTDWVAVATAYRAAGLGVLLHVAPDAARPLMAVLTRAGLRTTQPARGVAASTDGALRVQGWLPGWCSERDPGQWGRVPAQPPMALPGERVDLTASWRRRRVPVDPGELAAA